MNIEDGILHIMDNYLIEKETPFKENSLAIFIRNEIVDIISKTNDYEDRT